MLYAIGEIIVFLLLAALIGLLLGWLLRGFSLRRKIESQYEREVSNRQARISTLEEELRECRERSESIESEVANRVGELNSHRDLITTLEARLAEAESAASDLSGRIEGLTSEVQTRDDTIAALEARGVTGDASDDEMAAMLATARSDLAAKEAEIGALQTRLDDVTSKLSSARDGTDEITKALRGELASRDAELATANASLEAQTARIAELEAEGSDDGDAARIIGELRAELDARNDTITTLEATARTQEDVETELDQLRADIQARDAQLADLAAADVAETPAAPADDKAAAAEAARGKVAEIAARTAGDEPAPDDDLQRIKGIGPKISGLLRGMGITSFRQIARFTEDDIELVAEALESFPDRMRRDNWMQGAAELHREKYGSDA